MKAGVAVQLKLAAELIEPRVDVTWIWYSHEEVSADLNGLGRLARVRPDLLEGDFAILGEPTNAVVEGGCNGNLRVEVRAFGTRAHSARAWVGHNAIHDLAPVLATLAGYQPAEVEVDGSCTVRASTRSASPGSGRQRHPRRGHGARQLPIRAKPLRRRGGCAPARALPRLRRHGRRPRRGAPGPGLDAPLAREFVAAVGGVALPKYGWTDVARFSALGVPAVNYGPGDPLLATLTTNAFPSPRSPAASRAVAPGSMAEALADRTRQPRQRSACGTG
ncbi:MAG: hypothetical protein WDM88_12020 [Galbitalea sp.]